MASASTYTYILKIDTDPIPASTVLSLALHDPDRDKLWSFADNAPNYEPIGTGLEIAKLADTIVVHSDFALKTLRRLYGIQFDDVIDTLKLAEAINGKGGNKLSDWAKRLGMPRADFRGAPAWSQTAQKHCEHDARIITALYQHLGALVDG